MKCSVWLLTAVFFFSYLEIPLEHSQASDKRCCCGSAVCRCSPAEGHACPLKKKAQEQPSLAKPMPARKSCHGGALKKTQDTAVSVSADSKKTAQRIFFRASGCGSKSNKASLSSHAKDAMSAEISTSPVVFFYSKGFRSEDCRLLKPAFAVLDPPPRP